MILCIDPGQQGGLCWSIDGDPVECAKMPATDVEVCQLIADLSLKAKDVELFLEEPSVAGYGPLIPASAIARLAQNYGMIYGASVAMGFIIHRITPWARRRTTAKAGRHTSVLALPNCSRPSTSICGTQTASSSSTRPPAVPLTNPFPL